MVERWQHLKSASKSALGDFEYDVFISYRQRDPEKTWVRDLLVPALRARELRMCVDYENFRLGTPLIREIERAVNQSRYTLAILTPGYLESNFTDLENVLAEHLGLERTERRLLAVMREYCEPRLGIRARLWMDMTRDKEFGTNLTRLIDELRQPPGA
jgi:hypothetical protein